MRSLYYAFGTKIVGTALVLFFSLVALTGQAFAAPRHTGQTLVPDQTFYHCQVARLAHTPPALSHSVTHTHPALCPAGQVPQPVARHALKGMPRVSGSKHIAAAGATYFYGDAYQYQTSVGAEGFYSQHDPYLDTADYHSLAEIAVESQDGQQIVEIGWTVDRGVNGDAQPHLFMFHWVNGVGTCYNGCGFVQTSPDIAPGMTVSVTSTPQWYAIEHYQGNWWFWYQNEWFGYLPDSLWNGNYTQSGLTQWFGEVAASSSAPCTDMGDGVFGTNSGSAVINSMQFITDPSTAQFASATSSVTNASDYNDGNFTGSSFSYGGPGAC